MPHINTTRPLSINLIRRDGHEWGKKEAQIAIHTLGDSINREAAIGWINRAIENRADYLRASGLSPSEIKTWDAACRITFMLNIHYVLP
jgi:hypothetical protein